nr:retrovirus-related Pol polyprotein from transposon TNT 1-94 [Tanacetum cinerariifolium]
TGRETIVYADSDHVGDYIDRKITSGVCTCMRCCLTSWFAKKPTALAISTIEAEYVFAEKASQQALWMKQALIDYGIHLDDVQIMCDNKGAIDLIVVTDSLTTDYDSTDESSVYSIPLPSLEKLGGAEPVSGPKTIKSILKSNFTFKTKASKNGFQDSLDDEEDTRSSQEYMNDLEEEYQPRALLAKFKRFFKKGLIAESYDWDEEEEVSSDDNEVTEVKALMALAEEERVSIGKESTRNGEWIKISMKKVHTLFEMKDNVDRKSFLDYLYIDLNYVEEQRNNLMSKHKNLVQELNICKEQLLVLKQAKLDLLTMQHVNTDILKENQNLRNELKELTSITEAWLNISNKVNQCISEQIPTQKKKILRIDQLTEDTSSSGPKDPAFVKSLADNLNVSITGSNKPKLSEAEDSTLSNHDTVKRMNLQSVAPLPPLEKLTGAEPVSRPKTIKSFLKLKSTFKAETLKGITINEPS